MNGWIILILLILLLMIFFTWFIESKLKKTKINEWEFQKGNYRQFLSYQNIDTKFLINLGDFYFTLFMLEPTAVFIRDLDIKSFYVGVH